MKKNKLKRKIWIASFLLSGLFIFTMAYIPTSYFQLLPIFIPTSILTAILPFYMLENKNQKETAMKLRTTPPTDANNKEPLLENHTMKNNTVVKDIVDDIMQNENLTLQEKRKMLSILKEESLKNTIQQKTIQKTK